MDPINIALVIKYLANIYLKSQLGKKTPKGKKTAHIISHKTVSVLGKFCTRNVTFQGELKTVQSVIERYVARSTHKRPLNVLLPASPGGGKSFLAKEIANIVCDIEAKKKSGGKKIYFEEIYIPTLSNINDLHKKFTDISEKSKNEKSIPFIFFDEMDVDINGQHFYGNFLGPIWDGQVASGNNIHNLTPAVFLFAGSSAFPALSTHGIQNLARFGQLPISYESYRNSWIGELEQKIADDNAPRKLKDFVDRMVIFLCIPPTDAVLMSPKEMADEYMDVVYNIVKGYFNNIDTIDYSAMMCLMKELEYHPSRRCIESVLMCASCPERNKKSLFSHLPNSVRNRYKNDKSVQNCKGTMVKFS